MVPPLLEVRKMAKYTHLIFDERLKIQALLLESISFRQIARELHKDPSTISKEIRNHLRFVKIGSHGKVFNDCLYAKECTAQHLCQDKNCRAYCKYCNVHKCRIKCPDYKGYICAKLSNPPYVCNGCKTKTKCTLEKRLYDAKSAQAEYETVLSQSRKGIQLTEQEALRLDAIISPLLRKGQSLHHICIHNRDTIMQNERTLYTWMDLGIFSARNIDMPRKVRMGFRKPLKQGYLVDLKCREARTYDDYLVFLAENPDILISEMDSVEGTKGGKVLLTIHFETPKLMLAFIRDANTSQSVIDIFDYLEKIWGLEAFQRMFPVLLSDNGSEFSNPYRIETNAQGLSRTRVFYCKPRAPYQRGPGENNHAFLRRIIPKGTSMDGLTQADIDLMMSHINSYSRKDLGNKSPYEVFAALYGEELLTALGAKKIPPADITLRPTLLKK